MPFWNLASSEPRRAHRFLLNLPNLGDYQEYLCKTVTKPAYTISETEHKFMGNTYYYPGAVSWDAVTAQLVNAVTPDGNAVLMQALYNSGYMDPDAQDAFFGGGAGLAGQNFNLTGPGTPNKADALAALGDVIIRELDGEGKFIGAWTLQNPFITNVKFGDLDYSTEDLLNIDLTFRYDFATYVDRLNEPITDREERTQVIGSLG
jgi:hypothetical protein